MKTKYKQMYMEMAECAAKYSVAKKLKVGCVIVTESGGAFPGLNGTYPGCYTNDCEDTVIYPGATRTTLKTKPEVRHAERAALDKMICEGVSSKGGIVFITHSPCRHCAMSLIGAQIKEVYYKTEFNCRVGIDLLSSAGILIEKFEEVCL